MPTITHVSGVLKKRAEISFSAWAEEFFQRPLKRALKRQQRLDKKSFLEGIRCDSGRQLLTRSFVLTFLERAGKRCGGKVWAAPNVLEVVRDSDKQGHQGHRQEVPKKIRKTGNKYQRKCAKNRSTIAHCHMSTIPQNTIFHGIHISYSWATNIL